MRPSKRPSPSGDDRGVAVEAGGARSGAIRCDRSDDDGAPLPSRAVAEVTDIDIDRAALGPPHLRRRLRSASFALDELRPACPCATCRSLPGPGRAGVAPARPARDGHASRTPSWSARGACRSAGATATRPGSTPGTLPCGARASRRRRWVAGRSRHRSARGVRGLSAAGSADRRRYAPRHREPPPPTPVTCYRHPDEGHRPSVHPLRPPGLQRLPGAGLRRLAVPRLRARSRSRRPGRPMRRWAASRPDDDDEGLHRHQRRRLPLRHPPGRRPVLVQPRRRSSANYGLNPILVDANGEWWRIFTSGFVHFGLLHLALNMLVIYQVVADAGAGPGTGPLHAHVHLLPHRRLGRRAARSPTTRAPSPRARRAWPSASWAAPWPAW